MNITTLPPQILHRIFSNLPLPDLLKLHLIYPQWSSIQQSICSNQHSLTILIGSTNETLKQITNARILIPYESNLKKNPNSIKFQNQLEFDWLDSQSAQFLIQTFPSITHFTVSIFRIPPYRSVGEQSWSHKSVIIEQLIHLLNNWKQQLEHLKLHIEFLDRSVKHQIELERNFPKLFDSINCLSNLRHLTLDVSNLFDYHRITQPIDLSILSTIHEFNFDYIESSRILYGSLEKYAKSNHDLKKIILGNEEIADLLNQQFYHENLELLTKFHHLPMAHLEEAIDPIDCVKFCSRFSGLRSINVTFRQETIEQIYEMLKCLEKLTELVYLNVNFWKDKNQNYENMSLPATTIPRLPSVRILYITAPIDSHFDLYPIQWNHLLPGLEILHYNEASGFDCRICKFSTVEDVNIRNSLRKECIRLCIQPWKGCKDLKEVYWGHLHDWPDVWDLKQLWI